MAGSGYAGRERLEHDRLKGVFSSRLNAALTQSRLTRAELMDRVGVTSSTLTAWLLGRRLPRICQLTLIAQALGVPVAFLLDGHAPVPDDLGPTTVEDEVLQYIQTENLRKHRPSGPEVLDVFPDIDVSKVTQRLISFKFLEPTGFRLTASGRGYVQKLEEA